ncbi:hypothetical protein ACOSQ3_031177 [Xanthoceras sorbifolium]
MADKAVPLLVFFYPQVPEASTIFHGIRLAADMGLVPILVESDVLRVINVLHDRLVPCSDLGLVISNIFHLVSFVNIVNFSLVHWTANKVADSLASCFELSFILRV